MNLHSDPHKFQFYYSDLHFLVNEFEFNLDLPHLCRSKPDLEFFAIFSLNIGVFLFVFVPKVACCVMIANFPYD